MCNPVLWVAGAAMAVGAARKGVAEKSAQNDAASSLDYQGAVERDNAQAEAGYIRRQGRRDLGTTLTNIAASGVKVGEGSAGDAERQVMQDTETDAEMAILNGERRARGLNAQAITRRRAGRDAMTGAWIEAGTSLLSTGAGGFKAPSSSYNYAGDASGLRFSANGAAVRARR